MGAPPFAGFAKGGSDTRDGNLLPNHRVKAPGVWRPRSLRWDHAVYIFPVDDAIRG
jgi:hypothetical protein